MSSTKRSSPCRWKLMNVLKPVSLSQWRLKVTYNSILPLTSTSLPRIGTVGDSRDGHDHGVFTWLVGRRNTYGAAGRICENQDEKEPRMSIAVIPLRPKTSGTYLEPEDPHLPDQNQLCQIKRRPLPLHRHQMEHLHHDLG